MTSLIWVTVAALFTTSNPTMPWVEVQATQAAVEDAPAVPRFELPEVEGAVVDPTCGPFASVARIATCVASTQVGLQDLADKYTAAFEAQGWLIAAGEDNRIVFVRRREGGGCDGFQVQAFTDESRLPNPAEPAYLAFAAIPGNICAAPDTQGGTPQ